MLNFSVLTMHQSSSGSQTKCFEYLFIILGPTEAKLYPKKCNSYEFLEKNAKNNILPGSHLKNLFLPNKNQFSMVSDGIGNFKKGKVKNLFLTLTPTFSEMGEKYNHSFWIQSPQDYYVMKNRQKIGLNFTKYLTFKWNNSKT